MALPSMGFQSGIVDFYNGLWGQNSPWYQPPKPEAPPAFLQAQSTPTANTHGIGEVGMTQEQIGMINPRTQISQALLKQRMGG